MGWDGKGWEGWIGVLDLLLLLFLLLAIRAYTLRFLPSSDDAVAHHVLGKADVRRFFFPFLLLLSLNFLFLVEVSMLYTLLLVIKIV